MEEPNPVVNLEEHPLQNQMILKIIFDLLQPSATLQDWKNIRLVCKLWHSQTLSRWRKNAILDLGEETPIFRPDFNSKKLSASSLLLHWQNPNDPYKLWEKPFVNFSLQMQSIDLTFCLEDFSLNWFWSTVGPWIKTLIFSTVMIETEDLIDSKLLEFLIEKAPNLENVTFDNLYMNGILLVEPDSSRKIHPKVVNLTYKHFLGWHFNCFPNLQKVRLHCLQPIEFNDLIFPHFPTISDQNPVQNSKVTHLDMINCIVGYKPMIRRFHNIKFPSLEQLSLNMNYPRDQYFRKK